MPSLTDDLATIEDKAISFVTHWMDDDDEQEHNLAVEAEKEIDAAGKALLGAISAASEMLSALQAGVAALEDCDTLNREQSADLDRMNAAIVAAVAAGISPK